ncbi:MAG: hypothetical protein ACE5KU_03605 [Nitrososphaerales archaeon]
MKRKIKKQITTVTIATLLVSSVLMSAIVMGPTYAQLVDTETSNKTIGATEIEWTSSFQDMNYDLSSPTITMTVVWTVVSGAAAYDDFAVKHFTPKSKKDPASGNLISAANTNTVTGGEVTVVFEFTELHLDKKRNVEIGNAHFKLNLMIDEDGDGAVDTLAGYGVNVHVEDPQ